MSWNQNQMTESVLVCVKPPVEYTLGVCLPRSVRDFTRLIQQKSAAQQIRLCMDNNAKKSILGQSWGMRRKTVGNLQRNTILYYYNSLLLIQDLLKSKLEHMF